MDSAEAPFQYYCQQRGMIIFPSNMQVSWCHCFIEEKNKKTLHIMPQPHYTMLLLDWCLFIISISILKKMAYLERKGSCL